MEEAFLFCVRLVNVIGHSFGALFACGPTCAGYVVEKVGPRFILQQYCILGSGVVITRTPSNPPRPLIW